MYTLFNYVTAFWSVVVMNCIQPVNWKYCYRIDQWLIPDIQNGIEIYLNPDSLYKEERDYLNSSKKDYGRISN